MFNSCTDLQQCGWLNLSCSCNSCTILDVEFSGFASAAFLIVPLGLNSFSAIPALRTLDGTNFIRGTQPPAAMGHGQRYNFPDTVEFGRLNMLAEERPLPLWSVGNQPACNALLRKAMIKPNVHIKIVPDIYHFTASMCNNKIDFGLLSA